VLRGGGWDNPGRHEILWREGEKDAGKGNCQEGLGLGPVCGV